MLNSITDTIPSCITSMKVEENSESSKTIEATCFFPEEFIGFQGHFPDNSILPAVIQLATVRELTAKALCSSLSVGQYFATRFKAMIAPLMNLQVRISIDIEDSEIHGRFKFQDTDGKILSAGKFTYLNTSR